MRTIREWLPAVSKLIVVAAPFFLPLVVVASLGTARAHVKVIATWLIAFAIYFLLVRFERLRT